MKGWLPVPGSAKGKLALLALEEFGANGYEDVSVVDLAARAGVTTGSLYHHFGSKLGLYDVARAEIEQRLLDRMEGALAADAEDGVRAALLVTFDAAIRFGAARMLAEPHPERTADPLAERLDHATADQPARGRLLIAAWREALRAVTDGVKPAIARAALARIAE